MTAESALCIEELFPSFLFLLYLLFRMKQLQYLVSFWSECVRTGSWLFLLPSEIPMMSFSQVITRSGVTVHVRLCLRSI